MTLNESLKVIEGRQLSSVEFVQDYVQLHFDGASLTAYTWPQVTTGSETISWGEKGHRDSLCNRIGVQVGKAEAREGSDLRIWFQDGAVVSVSLREQDYREAEALSFVSNQDGTLFVV